MSWDAHVDSMILHGATQAAIFSPDGCVYAQKGFDGITREEILNLACCLRDGGGSISFGGKGCITLKGIPGESVTAKAKPKNPPVEGEPKLIYQAVLGKTLIYVFGVQGEGERTQIMKIEDNFHYLSKYPDSA